jgi:23S rRNA (cytosine1962-C5)-methyltransferase
MGVGLYDPDSPISIKMVHHDGGTKLDETFFFKKIKYAYSLRKSLLETNTNSYRLLFGENDGFPGFIADVYADVLVVKLYSAIWFPFLEMILKSLIKISKVKTVVLRLSRKLQKDTKDGLIDGAVLFGNLANETIVFQEHGVHFSANVIKGHKTGYFLDHRDNRKRVGELSKGKRVLDVFSYAGGFSVHALAKGAKEVTSLDISAQALELAKDNARLNKHTGKHKTISGDAFNELERLIKNRARVDIVVIDPPSFAKSQKEIVVALKKYRLLAQLGVKLTSRGGMLVLASCSSRISSAAFFRSNEKVLDESNRSYTTFLKTTHDVDHPVTFAEGSYLKCGYYKFDS